VDRGERLRVEQTFQGYRGDERKQRAWSATDPGNRAIRDEVTAALLARLPAGPLLDVGCGTGWWLRRLADTGRSDLHGVDIQPERVELARAAAPEAEVAVADARELPFADEAFAAVTLLLVLSSLRDRAAMLAARDEALRVLAPGGMLLAWDVRRANPRNPATVTPPWRELGGEQRTITVLPWLARRLPGAYPALARVPLLQSHRLLAVGR
jgi:ubiquinone/menaquinone biosynthesis C-methylase UbiE